MFGKFRIPTKRRHVRHEEPAPMRELRYAEIVERKKKRRANLKVLFTFLILGSIVFLIFWLWSQSKVKSIVCSYGGEKCENDLASEANVILGKSMFAKLEIKHPYLPTKLKRQWPNKVNVEFGKPNILLIFNFSEEKFVGITENGYVINASNRAEGPILLDDSLSQLKVGDKVSSGRLDAYKELSASLANLKFVVVSEVRITSEDEIYLKLPENTQAILGIKNISKQLSSLQAIYESPTITNEGRTIDLRFSNPVLK